MKNIRFFMRVALIAAICPTVAESACAPALSSIHCLRDRSTVYMADELAQAYTAGDGSLSPQKGRGSAKSYAVTFSSADFITSWRQLVGNAQDTVVTIALRDGAHFILPNAVLVRIGITDKPEGLVETDARSMRDYARMLNALATKLCLATKDDEAAQIVRTYLEHEGISPRKVRTMRRAGWALQSSSWLDDVFAEYDGSVNSGSDTESVSSQESGVSTAASRLSFASEKDEFGHDRKRYDIAHMAFDRGNTFLKQRLKDGTLDLRDCGLTSVHDLGILHGVLAYDDRFKVRTIDLSQNDLTSLDNYYFAHFPYLETIILKENKRLNEIAVHAFSGLPNLRVIDISACGLTDLPEDLFLEVSKLEVLLLEHNRLSSLPRFDHLKHLSMLSIHHNELVAMPNLSAQYRLEVVNASYNSIAVLSGNDLPCPRRGSLRCLLLNDNSIAGLASGCILRLPKTGIVNLANNPMWQEKVEKSTVYSLLQVGYEQMSNDDYATAMIEADDIRRALFTDTCDKLFDYLLNLKLIKAAVLKEDVLKKCPLSNIHTCASDIGMFLYKYGDWIVLGATIIFGGIGAWVGYSLKTVAVAGVARVVAGAALGSAIGAAAARAGCKTWGEGDSAYCRNARGEVHMTSNLRRQYIGLYRIIALLSLLKQYLVACNTCLYWFLNYDEFIDDDEHLEKIMHRFEQGLHLAKKKVVARTNDAVCIAMVSELIADNPLAELQRNCPDDLFDGPDLASSSLTDKASFPFLGSDKLIFVREAIISFSRAARMVRCMLLNRYYGTTDHCRTLSLAVHASSLERALDYATNGVLTPTLRAMSQAHDERSEWYQELSHVKDVADETQRLLSRLVGEVETYRCLRRDDGVRLE